MKCYEYGNSFCRQMLPEMFQSKTEESENFFNQLNCLHPSLKFTFKKEKNNCLPFLDVNVERTVTGFETSVYRISISISITIFYFCSATTKTERNKQTYRTIAEEEKGRSNKTLNVIACRQ